jgi:hypothetical protein
VTAGRGQTGSTSFPVGVTLRVPGRMRGRIPEYPTSPALTKASRFHESSGSAL